ncbi:hypothetical protein GCM10010145_04450 [Streptomyces ruber]|uniref:NlpC/P60 domain-containing protein n=2 Tax=Streptomyces TaxID=1883 RepID=A0A918BAJ4_9ACTN|nr:C40 family peptidase [Streptomyces ruber]GGQ39816.1 hypothetical protein GCM10010145_04450 [Streptomyces ruber]
MAAHRRPRKHSPKQPLSDTTIRTAATLALAGAATATGFGGTGHADPELTPEQAKTRVAELYREAEAATETYNGAKERADTAQRRLDDLRDEAARRTELLDATQEKLGSLATAQYRGGGLDPAWQLALSDDPDRYLAGTALAERLGARQAADVTGVRKALRELEQVRDAAHTELATLRSQQAELRRSKETITEKLGAARRLLASSADSPLSQRTRPSRRTQRAGTNGTPDGTPDETSNGTTNGSEPLLPSSASSSPRNLGPVSAASSAARAPDSRAAAAITYAYSKLGSPYVWGATGPDAFDCSGLVQAAYRWAGVSLPRTTYAQIDVGRRVPRSRLLPGDLVFFYSGVSHVGIYVGSGRMIHAPHPSAPVRVAPIDEMPFAGAARVV